MAGHEKPSKLVQYGGVLCFIVLSLWAFYWFIVKVIFTVEQVISSPPSISFDKGALYMFGVAISTGALSIYMILELWAGKPPSDKFGKIITKVAITGAATIFLLPQIVHYPLSSYLKGRGYQVCHEASHRWLHYHEIVFVNDMEVCLILAKNKK